MGTKKTNFVILGLLSIEPMSGYDMKKFIATSIGHFWSESNGQLYPTLKELVDLHFIQLLTKEARGTKARDTYSITKKGSAALESWLHETIEPKSTHRDEELLKLFFGRNNSSQITIKLLEKRKLRAQEELSEFLILQQKIEQYRSSPHFQYWYITLQNGIAHAKAEVSWCEESIQELKINLSRIDGKILLPKK